MQPIAAAAAAIAATVIGCVHCSVVLAFHWSFLSEPAVDFFAVS